MNGLSVTVLVAVFLILLAGLFAVIVERTCERDEARDQLKRERREHEAATAGLDAENVRLHEALTEKQIADGTVRVPLLRSRDRVMPMHPTPAGVCRTCGGNHEEPCPLNVERPNLRLIPPQRDPEHDRLPESTEVSDYAWPALAREIEHDDLTAIMRATEEK